MKRKQSFPMLLPIVAAACWFGFLSTASAQVLPLSDTLQVNALRARIQSNGAFFTGGDNGMLLAPASPGSSELLPLMRGAGLWLGGKDSSGAIHLSAQLYNEGGKADFYPGALSENGEPYFDFNLIAAVGSDQIEAHRNDPTAYRRSVYGWPGRGNPYFPQIYGFDMPYNYWGFAGFYDAFDNWVYEPQFGDYPAIEMRWCPLTHYADAMRWFSTHDVGAHTQSGALPLGVEVHSQVLGFNCQEGSPADRTLYVIYKIIYTGTFPLDSAYFGLFLDFQVGNGNDDYIGCDMLKKVVYAYNGDPVDEGGFESAPPVVAVALLRGPLNDQGEEVQTWHFVPVTDQELTSPAAYFNQLAGRHPDGSPYPNDGLMYFGNPLNPNEWSEARDGNLPGERKAMASFGPFTLLPGAVNELVLGYTWVRKTGAGSVADNLSILKPTMNAVRGVYDNCMELYQGCPPAVSVQETNGVQEQWTALPNPFGARIDIESGASPLKAVWLYDATGKVVREWSGGPDSFLKVNTADLPPGFYVLKTGHENGLNGLKTMIKG